MKKPRGFQYGLSLKNQKWGEMFIVTWSQRILIAKNLNSENNHLVNCIFAYPKGFNQGNSTAFIFKLGLNSIGGQKSYY